MRFLFVAPDLGFDLNGEIASGGLQRHGRLVARALASSPSINYLSVWSQVDNPRTSYTIEKMLSAYAHTNLNLEVHCFGGSRIQLAYSIIKSNLQRDHDFAFYMLVNQAVLTALPGHIPYAIWEIGRELFGPISLWKYRALSKAHQLLSSSENTSKIAQKNNPGLPNAKVVHLCVEPPLYIRNAETDLILTESYEPSSRDQAVFILSRIAEGSFDKGHQELIEGWPLVLEQCPRAELWIGGTGNKLNDLKSLVRQLPENVANQIHFLGYLNDEELNRVFHRCRIFAMPSRGEGFGLVFVEAARYGIPCIGSYHDSVKEIVINNETGLLVNQKPAEVAEACIRLLSDNELAKRLGDGARQRYLHNYRFHHFRERLLGTLGLEA